MHHKKHLPVKMFFGMNFLNFQYNFFDILNSKTNIVEKSSIPYGSKMTIDAKDNNHHYIMFLARNTTGNGHGAFLLTGYGSGGSERYKIVQLDDGNAVSIEVSGTTYVVTPSITGNTVVSIIYLMESKRPTISVS